MTLASLRGSALALVVAVTAWSAGCATGQPPALDPAFATGAYAPARIAVLQPDVFVVLDQVGDNDPVQSAALGQAVTNETVRAVEQSLRARGYDVDLSARWDGIIGQDGSVLVNRDELGAVANGMLQFGDARASGQIPVTAPGFVAPQLAAKVGWATRSDALLYVNVKGVSTTSGKRTESILAGVFIVVIVLAIVLALVANSKGGGGNAPGVGGNGFHGQPVARAPSSFHGTPPGGHAASMPSGGFHGTPASGGAAGLMPSGNAMTARPGGAAAAMPSGSAMSTPTPAPRAMSGVGPGGGGWRGGAPQARPSGGYVYGGGPRVGVGVGIIVPLDGDTYTHDGDVQHEDAMFAGDELYVSMTLVSTFDGRVLWHARQELDLDAGDPRDVDRMVQSFVTSLPPRGGFPPPAHK